MAKKTKQYENKVRKMEKVEKYGVSGESVKSGMRGGGRASKKKNIHDSDDYEIQNTQSICVLIGTRPNEHPSEPLRGKKPRSRRCQQQYARKRTREEISALEKIIEVNKSDLKTDGAKLRGQ